MAKLADYSETFDSVAFETVPRKLLGTAWILLSQYADDTTIYLHGKPTSLKEDEKRSWQALDDLADLFAAFWCPVEISADGKKPERLKTSELLRMIFQEDLKWNIEIIAIVELS
ncbi:unnamed protein product [Porites lobata]|uniref:Uncharacterized protein n=1 Tax=Porites lobata TaxID=104759 RepID=A0ABN8QR97_9CNID|nr:unnamed protein product [Porites lobata]